MERNVGLDYFKLVMSICIVAFHCNGFLSEIPIFGYGIRQALRMGTTCFFIIAGYYLYSKINDYQQVKSMVFKLFKVYLLWMLIYIPFHHNTISSDIMPSYIAYIYTWIFGWGHLWFMPSLMMSICTLYFLKKRNINNYILSILLISLYLIGFAIQRLYIIGVDVPMSSYAFTRTFLFLGLPNVFLGYMLRKMNCADKIEISYKTYIIIGILITVAFFESYIPKYFGKETNFYLAFPFLCPLLFITVLKKGIYKPSDNFIPKLSGAIYFTHMFILIFISENTHYANTKLFIIVLFFTLIVSTVIVYLNKHLKIFL